MHHDTLTEEILPYVQSASMLDYFHVMTTGPFGSVQIEKLVEWSCRKSLFHFEDFRRSALLLLSSRLQSPRAHSLSA